MDFQLEVHFFGVHSVFGGHLLNDADYLGKALGTIFFHKGHQLLDFLLFFFADDHFVSFLHESVELLNELWVINERAVYFDKAIQFILCLLVFS